MCWQAKPAARSPLKGLLLCYITDRQQFPGSEAQKRNQLLARIYECAAAGVDYIQLRERDLPARDLELLACEALTAIGRNAPTRLLINSRTDVALACGAHGVHLPAGSLPASEVRALWNRVTDLPSLIGVSTHSAAEIASAEAHGADFAVFAPVFQKDGRTNPAGLEQLNAACRQTSVPVFALGGVALENARRCLDAGAAGIAGIRLFQRKDARSVAASLRSLKAASL